MREAIQAGAAFVELFVKDAKLQEGLNKALGETKARLSTMSAGTEATATAHASKAMMPAAAAHASHAATAGTGIVAAAGPRQVTTQVVSAQAALRGLGGGLNRLSWALSHSSKMLMGLSAAGRLTFGGLSLGLRAVTGGTSLALRGTGALMRGVSSLGGPILGSVGRWSGSMVGALGRGIRPLGGLLSTPLAAASGGFAKLGAIGAKNYVTSWKLWFAGRLATRAGAGGAAAAAAAGPAAGMLGAGAPGAAAAAAPARTVAGRTLASATGVASSASSAIRSIGMQAMGAGAVMAAAAAPIALLTARFTGLGKEVYDASKKTGVAAETLSALRYIGQQTGVEFDAMADAAGTLKAKSPEALADVADKLDKIKDPAARAAEATRLLGDQAPALAPALALGGAALRQMADDARNNGSVVSGETAKLADAVATGAKRIAGEAKAGWDQLAISIGGALIGDLEDAKARTESLVGGIRGAVRGVTQWIGANEGLAANIIQGIAVVGLLGTALVAAGGAITMLGTAATAVAGFLGALLSPTVLITAALAAGAYAWARYTATGQAAVSALKDAFGPVIATVKDTIGGVMDALTAGDLGLAARIAFGGIKVAALQALGGLGTLLDKLFETGVGQSIKTLATDLIQGNWSNVAEDLLNLWGNVVDGIVGMMARAVNGVINLWRGMVSGIAGSLVKMAAQDGVMGRIARTIVGRDLRGKMGPETGQQQAMRRRNLEEAQVIRKQELAKATAAGDQGEIDKWTAAIAQGEQELAAIGQAGGDMMTEASRSIAQQTAQWGSGVNAYMDSLRQTTRNRAADRNQALAENRQQQGQPGFADMLAREQADLDAMRAEAADKAAKARQAAEAGAEGGEGGKGGKKGAGLSSGSGATFSAFAAQYLGGFTAQERTARNTEKALTHLDRIAKLDEEILRGQNVGGIFGGTT